MLMNVNEKKKKAHKQRAFPIIGRSVESLGVILVGLHLMIKRPQKVLTTDPDHEYNGIRDMKSSKVISNTTFAFGR